MPAISHRARALVVVARHRARSQAGMTLMEVILAIGVISIAMIGVFAGLGTTIRASGSNARTTSLQRVLASVTESIQQMPYQRCRDAATLTADYASWTDGFHPAGYTVTVTEVTYAVTTGSATSFVSTCPAGSAAKKLRVSVAPTGSTTAVVGEVVVRDPAARPA